MIIFYGKFHLSNYFVKYGFLSQILGFNSLLIVILGVIPLQHCFMLVIKCTSRWLLVILLSFFHTFFLLTWNYVAYCSGIVGLESTIHFHCTNTSFLVCNFVCCTLYKDSGCFVLWKLVDDCMLNGFLLILNILRDVNYN